ncbi:hypothetical protein QPM17_18720 [Marinobacter sp. TBZ242]|uniref:Uncharacterized protein n=1 Tax=Marinobacter azerbaijanicus TaxID=3050455 RepID=A0ABT7IG80_9GAMM|nr:hypothetical protein [Marinobacter sp. TBZ242]MDL0433178.1 hypothetical protein [Marinobacter sp. TBZ242]
MTVSGHWRVTFRFEDGAANVNAQPSAPG